MDAISRLVQTDISHDHTLSPVWAHVRAILTVVAVMADVQVVWTVEAKTVVEDFWFWSSNRQTLVGEIIFRYV